MSVTAALRDLNKLNAFVRVAERRSFTKAAADLRTTPSVLSKHIKELEDSLGFSLFNRSTHGIVLTDTGEELFQSCLQMLVQLDEHVVRARNLQAGPFGTLRVQATSEYARCVLAPLIFQFARRYPALRVHLSVLGDDSAAAEEGFDVILASKKPALPGLVEQDLGGIRYVVCASPGYFERVGRPKEPNELREYNCLVNLFSGPHSWPFQASSRQQLVKVKGTLSSNSYAVLIQMAVEGFGIVRVPHHAVKAELANKSLEPIFDRLTLSPERICAYYSKAKHLPAKTSEFISFLKASMAAR
jgi:DNA-binding transcriptional LysR family regulator